MVILEQKVDSLGLSFDQVPHLTRWWMQRRAKSVGSKMTTTQMKCFCIRVNSLIFDLFAI